MPEAINQATTDEAIKADFYRRVAACRGTKRCQALAAAIDTGDPARVLAALRGEADGKAGAK